MEKKLKLSRPVIWSERPPFPHNMLMELTNSCNQECVFCGYKKMQRKKRLSDKSFMFDIMSQAYNNGTREIGFYMIGEPFMCPDLEDYIANAKKLGYEYIYLTTNGALASIERMENVIAAGLSSIKYSVNAATRNSYRLIHGRDDFIGVKTNIEILRKYVIEKSINLPMFITFVKNEINKNEIDKLYDVFGKLVDKIYIYDCVNQGGGMLNQISDSIIKKGEILPGSDMPCEMIFNRLHITCEGYLDACCADVNGYMTTSDLHEIPLIDAWNSDIMIDLRRQHLSGKLRNIACYNCLKNTNIGITPLNKELSSIGKKYKEML